MGRIQAPSGSIRTLLEPAYVPCQWAVAWHSGLTASPNALSLCLIIEGSVRTETFPLKPTIGIKEEQSNRLLLGLRAGSEEHSKLIHMVCKQAPMIDELSTTKCTLEIIAPVLGIEYSAPLKLFR